MPCRLPRSSDADHFTHKELAKPDHQGNHQRAASEADYGL